MSVRPTARFDRDVVEDLVGPQEHAAGPSPDWTVTVKRRRGAGRELERTGPGDDAPTRLAFAAKNPDRPALASLGRFELREELGRGGMGVVYEAYDPESRAVVALKTLVSMDAEHLFRLKHEFRALANLEHENFVRLEELSSVGGHLFFTMERVHGEDFLGYVRPQDHDGAGRLDEARLRSALAQLVEGLGALHAAGRIHRDVKPSNVLVTAEGRLVLLDFGLTSSFARGDHPTAGAPLMAHEDADGDDVRASHQRIFGTPAYMAPEQLEGTALSPATDWYAVGVMLYVALTGELPFRGDILDIAFAKQGPDGPTLVGEAIPEDLRALCLALLKAEPAARPPIRDIRSRLGLAGPAQQVEEVFVGRKTELERLRTGFVRARTQTHALLVSGEPGIGKSALVERFLAELHDDAIVLRGRCYEQESVPFGGVDSLMDGLSDYLLGLSESDVAVLFAGGVSHAARVFPVLYRVPFLAALRVEGPAVSDASLRDHAIRELAQIFAALGRVRTPVLYLDDLQWVDPESLALIREALLGKGVRCLFVATIRSSGARSPELAGFVADLECVEMGGLSGQEALDVCDAVPTLAADVRERVLLEASGHPMFLAELLRSARAGTWVHEGGLRLQDVLWGRIAERDDVERAFLEVTALAGLPTPYAVLARAAELDRGECRSRLAGLRAAQLVRISKLDGDRCVEPYHDRVREALLERLGAAAGGQLTKLHLRLGRALLEATAEDSLGSRIFSIVQHLNSGRAHIDTSGEKRRLAELNLLAGRKAMDVTAFDRARLYAETGLECLREACGEEAQAWSREPSLCRELHLVRMVGEYRTGHRDRALDTFDAAKRHVRDPVDRTDLYVTLIDLEGPNSFDNAIEAGREILGDLGAPLPRRTTKLHVLAEYVRTRWSQRGRRPDELQRAPPLRDPRTQSAMRALFAVAPPSFIAGDVDLFALNVLRQARISFERGLGEISPVGLMGYGITLAVVFGKHQEADAFGRLAIELADRDKHPRIIGAAHCAYAVMIQPWVMGFARSFEEAEKARELSHAYGDTVYEAFSHATATFLSVAMGRDIEQTQRVAERGREFAAFCKIAVLLEATEAWGRYASALRGQTASLADVSVPGSDQSAFLASLGEFHGRVWMNLILAELSYLADDLSSAESHLRAFHRRSRSVLGTPATADIWLLSALIAARGHEAASAAGRVERIVQVVRSARKLDAWARTCPEGFEPHASIARAELARIRGRVAQAADAYERAIAAARTYDAPKREAIACELAGRHAWRRGSRADAERYRDAAVEAYRRWGATAKARMLEGSSYVSVG